LDNLFLTKLLESGYTEDPLDEILAVLTLMAPDFPGEPLIDLHREIGLILKVNIPSIGNPIPNTII